MKNWCLGLCVIVISLSSACNRKVAPVAPSPAEMIAAAEKINKQLVDSINKKDIETYGSLYWDSSDLVVLDVQEYIVGAQAWKDAIGQWFKTNPGIKLEISDSHNIVSGDVVVGWQNTKMHVPVENAPAKTEYGLHSNVIAFRNGKWVIITETYVKLPDPIVVAPAEPEMKGNS